MGCRSLRTTTATGALLVMSAAVALSACTSAVTSPPARSTSPAPSTAPLPSPYAPTFEPTVSATPSIVPSPTIEPGLAWSRVPDAPALRAVGGGMGDVVAGGPGFVAVGSGYANDASFAVAWTSIDGLTWERVPHTSDFDDVGMFAVTAGGPGFVAVGGGCCPDRAAVWTSIDGRSWARVPSAPALENASLRTLVAWDRGLLAIGCEAYTECAGALLLASADGLTWDRIAAAGLEDGLISDVGAGGPGLVAVGLRCPPGEVGVCRGRPAVWVSPDGVIWRDVPLDDGAFGGISAVAATATSFVALGNEYDEALGRSVVTLRTSPDGLAWTRAPTPDLFAGAEVSAVRAVRGAFFALGQQGLEEAIPTIWRSVDGLEWAIVLEGSPADSGSLSDLATDGMRLVAVGMVADSAPALGANGTAGGMIWTSPATP